MGLQFLQVVTDYFPVLFLKPAVSKFISLYSIFTYFAARLFEGSHYP